MKHYAIKLVDGLQKQTNVPLSIKEITSLSFNIRCPGEITVYHDDKVSKIDRDGTVSGKKIKTSSYNWISGTYVGSLDMAEFEQEWFAKSGKHGKPCIMGKRPNCIGFKAIPVKDTAKH